MWRRRRRRRLDRGNAGTACTARGRQLPTFEVLLEFFSGSGSLAPGGEWTADVFESRATAGQLDTIVITSLTGSTEFQTVLLPRRHGHTAASRCRRIEASRRSCASSQRTLVRMRLAPDCAGRRLHSLRVRERREPLVGPQREPGSPGRVAVPTEQRHLQGHQHQDHHGRAGGNLRTCHLRCPAGHHHHRLSVGGPSKPGVVRVGHRDPGGAGRPDGDRAPQRTELPELGVQLSRRSTCRCRPAPRQLLQNVQCGAGQCDPGATMHTFSAAVTITDPTAPVVPSGAEGWPEAGGCGGEQQLDFDAADNTGIGTSPN